MTAHLKRINIYLDTPPVASPHSPASELLAAKNLANLVIQKRCPGCGVMPLATNEYPHIVPCWVLAAASWWAHKRGESPRDHGIRIVAPKDLPE